MEISANANQDIPYNCSTIVVGKDVSTTGRVIIGHNEDDWDAIVQAYHVPRKKHLPHETVSFGDGSAVIPQVEETYSYYWSEMRAPGRGMSYSDTFVNEWGVAIVSNSCVPCREPEDGPQEAGLGYGLRRLVAERAKTAREGVELAIGLVEQFGYMSCRSYQIADQNEAWVLQLTQGRHYAARRVPDGEVMYIPNWYTIHQIDWKDTKHENFYFSPDLAEFAEKNGWYDPAKEGCCPDFDFAAAYQSGEDSSSNILRARGAWRILLGREPEDLKAFSAKPAGKMGPEDVKRVLRSHYENTPDDATDQYIRNPHMGVKEHFTVCSCVTVESCVIVFDGEPDLTCIWRAAPVPCVSPYVPWYLGISAAPEGYAWYDVETAQRTHFSPADSDFRYNPLRAYWAFQTVRYLTEFDYRGTNGEIRKSIRSMESHWNTDEKSVKDTWHLLRKKDPELAREFLTDYTARQGRAAWGWANEMIRKLGEEKIAQNSVPHGDLPNMQTEKQ